MMMFTSSYVEGQITEAAPRETVEEVVDTVELCLHMLNMSGHCAKKIFVMIGCNQYISYNAALATVIVTVCKPFYWQECSL